MENTHKRYLYTAFLCEALKTTSNKEYTAIKMQRISQTEPAIDQMARKQFQQADRHDSPTDNPNEQSQVRSLRNRRLLKRTDGLFSQRFNFFPDAKGHDSFCFFEGIRNSDCGNGE